MPTIDWIGKAAVLNHHRSVPYQLLHCDPAASVGSPGSGNLLVQGDNLAALKALLPFYGGKVKCVYIDPPYNTGNENWIYNDAVNSAEMRAWLGKVVGAEGEDLSRHDKWLCMMYPRISLLRDFLSDRGVLLVSIDDFEAHRLRALLDEIMGPQNFVAQLVWDKTRKNDAKLFSVGHEYILVYARSLQRLRELKTRWREQRPGAREIVAEWKSLTERHAGDLGQIEAGLRAWYRALPNGHPSKKLSRYKQVDQWGPWRDRDISWPGGGGPRYDVMHPRTGLPCAVPEAGWRFSTQAEMQRQISLGLVVFRDDHTQPPFRKAHLLPVPEEETGNPEEDDDGQDAEDLAGMLVMPSVIHRQAQVSVKLLRKMFGGRKVFPNPKDHEVLARLIRYCTDDGDIVLDSFAGSGSTGHAVLQINHEDGGSRRFVLIEMEEQVAVGVTSARLRSAISGVADLPALGGGFRFCRLGEPLFTADGRLGTSVTFADLAAFIYFVETGEPLPTLAGSPSPLLGSHRSVAYYLLFNGVLGDRTPHGGNVLTSATLQQLPPHPDGAASLRVIYGESCRLSSERLRREHVSFRQIPYGIRRF